MENTDPDIDLPTQANLKALYAVAQNGDMDEVTAHLDQLEEKVTKLKPF